MKKYGINILAGLFYCLLLNPCLAGEPLALGQAVRKALSYSPYLKAMEAGEQIAKEKVGEAKAMKAPKINIGISDSRLNSPMMTFGAKLNQGQIEMADFNPSRLNTPDYVNNFQIGAQVLLPVYLGGMDVHAVKSAQTNVDAARFDVSNAGEEIILRTIEAYLNVMMAGESVDVARKACEASFESVRNAQDAIDAQKAVASDLLQAKVRHSANEETLLRMRNQLSLALEGLSTMMGVASASDYDLTLPFMKQECLYCSEDPATLLRKALLQRPDFQKLRKQIEALKSAEKMFRGADRPKFFLGAGTEHNTDRIGGQGRSNNIVFGKIDWNVADGGEATHKTAGARKQTNQLKMMADALQDQIRFQIREAVTNINNSLERIRVTSEAVEQSKESLRIIRDRYNAGIAIMIDLLGAETSLQSHQMNHIKALYDYALGRAKLKMALGELTLEHCQILND